LISEDFEGIDTLTFKVRYDMPSKSEANLWASNDIRKIKTASEHNPIIVILQITKASLAIRLAFVFLIKNSACFFTNSEIIQKKYLFLRVFSKDKQAKP
jgi:hypothetical protein